MPATVVVGCQWGDEGKGRIIDLLAEQADYIVRFQGGANAGHTLIDRHDRQVILHLIPSGILWPKKICVIGNGVVVNPAKLVEEINSLQQAGYLKDQSQLWISDSCHLVMPYHLILDGLEEEARGSDKIGTTLRGIGPAYMDKVARCGVRMADLIDEQRFLQRMTNILPSKQKLLKQLYNHAGIDEQKLIDEHLQYGEQLAAFVRQVPPLLNTAYASGKNLLFEGAQGCELDLDHGTYPYVTSTSTLAAAAIQGSGIGLKSIDRVLGVVKAYTTRVGGGPFVTEEHSEIGNQLVDKGKEFGATTGRKRRCGWLDTVQLRQALMLNGMDGIILTKLDVLSGFAKIPICVAYKKNGTTLEQMPTSITELAKVEPVYEELPGWDIIRDEIHTFEDLPKNARGFVRRIEELLEVPIVIASVGPKRENYLSHSGRPFSPFSGL